MQTTDEVPSPAHRRTPPPMPDTNLCIALFFIALLVVCIGCFAAYLVVLCVQMVPWCFDHGLSMWYPSARIQYRNQNENQVQTQTRTWTQTLFPGRVPY
ncbi:hypothetical protein ColTof4_00027 [Colletotrichum tofieldiae]|nr:hypothetical protein ColTof3_07223 [Colletotrichum tofieldiae]GKT67604.1 hypothetical protein ColTof4_00027 [Colletotrichum tofieldiae]GKT91448.1 hypothetical protein Ct61P_09298 [Colletotrichum tofieldiae]